MNADNACYEMTAEHFLKLLESAGFFDQPIGDRIH